MKTALTALLLFICLSTSAQFDNKTFALKLTSFAVAGAFDGLHDKIDFRYNDFKTLFPKSDDQFCNPDLSWRNKWRNGDPLQGEAFWQSSRMFVCSTDLFHLTNTGRTLFCCIGASIPLGVKPKFSNLVFQIIAYSIAYNTSKYMVYEIKKR